MWVVLLESRLCLHMIDLVSYDTTLMCCFFLIPGTRFWASISIKAVVNKAFKLSRRQLQCIAFQ